jgi:hypothetical protein
VNSDLSSATAEELSNMLLLFQTAYNTAVALQTTIDASFDANNVDALFASGVDPVAMAASLEKLYSISTSMVFNNDIVNRVARMIIIIQLAQLGIT